MARKSRKQLHGQALPSAFCEQSGKVYKTAAYARLSSEDKEKSSIGTQKAMLLDYIETQPDLRLYSVYEDVNYTGTNFARPGFRRMLSEIQAGLIDCVLVKDLSRLGRNFLETGHLLERVFPLHGIRFISIGDGYDSFNSLDDSSLLVPLKNLMNESYSRDISRKVLSVVKLKQKRGQFTGSFAPYGYIKDGTAFMVDEEAAKVVRKIFGWILDGLGDNAIAQRLNNLKILPPSRHRFEKGFAKNCEQGCIWHKSTVKRISENLAYTGVMAQGKSGLGATQGEPIIVKDTHPAIISAEAFESAQRLRESRKQSRRTDTRS